MTLDLAAFHFLRPLWLLLMVPGILLPLLWLRRHDIQRQLRGIIAPHLVASLVITPARERTLHPIHLLASLLVLGGGGRRRPHLAARYPSLPRRPGSAHPRRGSLRFHGCR